MSETSKNMPPPDACSAMRAWSMYRRSVPGGVPVIWTLTSTKPVVAGAVNAACRCVQVLAVTATVVTDAEMNDPAPVNQFTPMLTLRDEAHRTQADVR